MSELEEERCYCPICGHRFKIPEDINESRRYVCPTTHTYDQSFLPDQLIKEDDDYAWVL